MQTENRIIRSKLKAAIALTGMGVGAFAESLSIKPVRMSRFITSRQDPTPIEAKQIALRLRKSRKELGL